MVARSYCGLGPPAAAVGRFDALKPYVVQLLGLQAECEPLKPNYMALGVALDGLQTAAFHFTRRPHFYHELEAERPACRAGNNRLADPAEAVAAFEALTPYANALRGLQGACRPFGRDYLALSIALQSLDTAAFHFTRDAHFFGAKADSAGPIRAPR